MTSSVGTLRYSPGCFTTVQAAGLHFETVVDGRGNNVSGPLQSPGAISIIYFVFLSPTHFFFLSFITFVHLSTLKVLLKAA
jgi:hypothetical protein